MTDAARAEKILVSNRRARHEYHILDTIETGIALRGTEVKSLREGKANLQDSFAIVRNGEVWLLNAHISPYTHGSFTNHDPTRERRLLLHAREIRKLGARVQASGLTLVPLKMYLAGRLVKVELAVARGKHAHDKREAIRARDQRRAQERGEE